MRVYPYRKDLLISRLPDSGLVFVTMASRQEAAFLNASAAVRDYNVEPRLEYRTIAGVQGPLVILENIKCPKFAEIVNVR